jgi:pyridoxal phosphate enzyme (YggS family)
MKTVGSSLVANLDEVLAKIAGAAQRSNRPASDVHLVAVSKTKPLELIDEAYAAGQTCFGENYVQELTSKVEARPSYDWHFIGSLQTNKVKQVAGRVGLIHSVDREKLLHALAKAVPDGRRQKILLQVHIGEEQSKAGVTEAELEHLLRQAVELPTLEVSGLMALPPLFDDESSSRAGFAQLRRIFERCQQSLNGEQRLKFCALSMGTSHDYEWAILEGATHVRVGTAIFGARS